MMDAKECGGSHIRANGVYVLNVCICSCIRQKKYIENKEIKKNAQVSIIFGFYYSNGQHDKNRTAS